MRRRGRVDNNQAGIVAGLREVGATVEHLSGVGKGCVDLLVGFRSQNFLIEVKNRAGYAARKSGGRTEAQNEWHSKWRGQADTAYTLDDALRIIGARI